MFPRISHDPEVLGGKACVRGTRPSVEFILGLIASGGTPQSISASYPVLSPEDVIQAVQYAAYVVGNSWVRETRVAG